MSAKEVPPVGLGARLRARRAEKGVSLRSMERASGINSGYLSQLERGEIANPAPSVLQKVAAAYDEPLGVLMRWAGYIEEDAAGISPNAKRALNVLGDDFTDDELKALRAVLDVMRGGSKAHFDGHRTDHPLDVQARRVLEDHASRMLRELGAQDTDAPVDLDQALSLAKLVRGGAIELSPTEQRSLREAFGDLVDKMLSAVQGAVLFKSSEVLLNPGLDRWDGKKRFVLAHEIAHAVLPAHREIYGFLDDNDRLGDACNDQLEREANQFAIELLAKGDQLRSEFDDSSPTFDSVESLTAKYRISFQAAARRLAEESRRPIAVAVAWRRKDTGALGSGRKLWFSESFEKRMQWGQRGTPWESIDAWLAATAARLEIAPVTLLDARGEPCNFTPTGMDRHYSVMVMLECPAKPRLTARRIRSRSSVAPS